MEPENKKSITIVYDVIDCYNFGNFGNHFDSEDQDSDLQDFSKMNANLQKKFLNYEKQLFEERKSISQKLIQKFKQLENGEDVFLTQINMQKYNFHVLYFNFLLMQGNQEKYLTIPKQIISPVQKDRLLEKVKNIGGQSYKRIREIFTKLQDIKIRKLK